MRRFICLAFFLVVFFSHSFAVGIPKAGEKVFTIQVGSFKTKKKAMEVLEKVKDFPYARISYRDGRFKVRVGFFRTFKKASAFGKEKRLDKIAPDYYVTVIQFSPENVEFFSTSPPPTKVEKPSEVEEHLNELVKGNETSTGTEESESQQDTIGKTVKVTSSPEVSVEKELPENVSSVVSPKTLPEEERTKVPLQALDRIEEELQKLDESSVDVAEKNSTQKNYFPLLLIPAILIPLGALTARRVRKDKGKKVKEADFERFIASLLEEDNYERVLEIGIPYLSKHPEDTFIKKAVAESLEKTGRYLEASTLYVEIAEELRKKGLNILADTFEKKAESLSSKEFKGG